MAIEHVKTWRVGDVEISRIVEVNGFADDLAMLLEGGGPEDLARYPWLAPHFATPEGKMVISFQAFVVKTPERRIMVDTCIGNDRTRHFGVFNDMQTSFLEDIAAVGCPAESIDTVLCTHLHFDHTGWNTRRVDGKWVPTFPNARYLMSRAEFEDLQHEIRTGGHYTGHVPDSIQPVLDAGLVDFIDIPHQPAPEIRLFPTPGHTAGHCSVHISSRGEEAVITGDLMHHPIQCAEPDRPGNFDALKEVACRTRREFLQSYGDGRALVIGSHFADPTAGRVVRDGQAWRLDVSERAKVGA
jgi:glyoxylase-like metal-dependent hydrolase (beta-lactamase superfamily II)